MTAPAGARTAAWSEALAPLLVLVWFAAGIVLTDRFLLVEGDGAWAVWSGVAVSLAGVSAYPFVTARGRRLRAERAGIDHALRTGTDPGPDLRERTDRAALGLARLRWVLWCYPLMLFGFLPPDLTRPLPLLVGACAVLVVVPTLGAVRLGRQVRDARRWLADLPGPLREPPEPRPIDRWTTGRRLVLLAVALGVVIGALSVLVVRLAR